MKTATEPRQTVLEALRRRGPLTIDELGTLLELSKTATRAHVLRLEEAGLIGRVEDEPQGPGRPPVRFGLTESGGASFPTRDAEILEQLLVFLGDKGQRELVIEFFSQLWARRRAALLGKLGVDSFSDSPLTKRLRHLRLLLEDSHFMPQIASRNRASERLVVIRECNCPLPAAVRATRIPCRLEAEFLAEVTGGRMVSMDVAADRTETCTFELQVAHGEAGRRRDRAE